MTSFGGVEIDRDMEFECGFYKGGYGARLKMIVHMDHALWFYSWFCGLLLVVP